jgi:hypothetical protein
MPIMRHNRADAANAKMHREEREIGKAVPSCTHLQRKRHLCESEFEACVMWLKKALKVNGDLGLCRER